MTHGQSSSTAIATSAFTTTTVILQNSKRSIHHPFDQEGRKSFSPGGYELGGSGETVGAVHVGRFDDSAAVANDLDATCSEVASSLV